MNTTLTEREARAYATNDQVTLAALIHSEKELLDGVPTEEELKAERAEAEAWEGLAMKLGDLVCVLADSMVEANKEERRVTRDRLADLSRSFGGFINPRRYVAGTHLESIEALARDVDLMADEVPSLLGA